MSAYWRVGSVLMSYQVGGQMVHVQFITGQQVWSRIKEVTKK